MDSLVTAAARALAAGDPLGALNRVALRDDAPALALRGIAMAQLGDLPRARALLKRAARAFGPREALARARCVVAEAEIALVSRDLAWPQTPLARARATLERRGDRANAAHARYLEARMLLLIGRLDAAERALGALDDDALPPASQAARALVDAGIAIRRLRTGPARAALDRAAVAARRAGIPSLEAEVEGLARVLEAPAARLIARGEERPVTLFEIEVLPSSGAIVVDACRSLVRTDGAAVSLATRPVLFALARTLGEAYPAEASRSVLLARAFGARFADESHRARLRVEIGRLRAVLRPVLDVQATRNGFALAPRGRAGIVVLAPLVDDDHAPVLALLADGEAWSSSSLALALSVSPRTVLRSLARLAEDGRVQPVGRGRARRWTMPPSPGFPTSLLLPGPPPGS